jgi:GNAT superfamily N-acetyltransferase
MPDSQAPLPPLQIVDEREITSILDAAVRGLLCECFPADAETFSVRRAWNDVHPAFSVLAWHGDGLAGHVGVVEREIICGGVTDHAKDAVQVRVAGIQSLAVAQAWRRSGLSQRLMTVAMQEAKRRGVRFGLLFCLPKLERFYTDLGWRQIDRTVTMRDALGQSVPLPAKNIIMYLALGELALDGEPLPSGPIDLEGRDW